MHILINTQFILIGIQVRRGFTSSIHTLPILITYPGRLMAPTHTFPTRTIHLVYQTQAVIIQTRQLRQARHTQLNKPLHNLSEQHLGEVSKNFSRIQNKSPIPLSWREESNHTESSGDPSLRAISLTQVSSHSVEPHGMSMLILASISSSQRWREIL
jgi:hypothetical protein